MIQQQQQQQQQTTPRKNKKPPNPKQKPKRNKRKKEKKKGEFWKTFSTFKSWLDSNYKMQRKCLCFDSLLRNFG